MGTKSDRKRPIPNETTDENKNPAEKDAAVKLNGILPLTRVKRLIKMSTLGSTNVSAGAVKLIQLCAEEYLRAFARSARMYAEQSGRKTIQPKDLNRLIKDDWAFALLEDALVDWPNDENKPIAFTVNEPDSSTLFIQNQPNSEAVDTQMTDREQPQLDDDYGDLQSEFNETHIFGEDPDITLANGDPTPKPTMEYLPLSDSLQCRLAEPLTFQDTNEGEEYDEDYYQRQQYLNLEEQNDDAQRPHNSRFMYSRRLVDESDLEDRTEELEDEEDSGTMTSIARSPNEFDIEDIENF